MISTARDILTMLDGESSLGLVANTDLYFSRMPNDPDDIVCVYDTPGSPPQLTYKKDTSNYYYSGVSVRVRNTDYEAAYAVMFSIMEFLHAESQITVGSTYYALIKAVNDPQVLNYDENDRVIMFVNFDVQRRGV